MGVGRDLNIPVSDSIIDPHTNTNKRPRVLPLRTAAFFVPVFATVCENRTWADRTGPYHARGIVGAPEGIAGQQCPTSWL